jgi:Leucine-rich repeat (LRR) protein
LAHNKLRQVPSRVFSHLTLLNSLELDGNNIDTIDPEAFAGLEGKILHKKKKNQTNSAENETILLRS